MVTRREFLFVGAAGSAFTMLGCRTREAVLKIPEDAEECFHLFKFFSDPNFDLEKAKTGLGITGEPKVMRSSERWLRNTFEDQKGVAKSVQLNTTTDERGEYLSDIYIYYAKPVGFSLSTMKANFGAANERTKKVPVFGELSPASFTNLMPGQKQKEVTTYSFFPELLTPGSMKGDVLITSDATYWDTKMVEFLRFQRRPV